MVQSLGVAPFDSRHRTLSQSGFDAHHGFGLGRCGFRPVAEQGKHFPYVSNVLLAQFDRLGIVLGVIVAVGQTESALVGVGDNLIGIAEILNRIKAEKHVVIHRGRGQVSDFRLGAQLGNLFQRRLQRLGSLGLDRLLVRAGGIVVANLLLDRVALGVGRGRSFQNPAQTHQIFVLHFGIGVPRRLVGGNGVSLDPPAAGISK